MKVKHNIPLKKYYMFNELNPLTLSRKKFTLDIKIIHISYDTNKTTNTYTGASWSEVW